MGLKTVHPFGSREAIEKIVHYACADSLAEIMGTLSVFGEQKTDIHTDSLSITLTQR
jgi:hypothetical protein